MDAATDPVGLSMPVPKRRLRTKLLLLLIGITAAPFIVATSRAILKFQDIQRENAVVQERRIAGAVVQEISGFIDLQFSHLDAIDVVYPILAGNADLWQDFFERMLFLHGSFHGIAVVNAEGQETVRVDRIETVTGRDLRNRSESEEFRAIQQTGLFVGEIYWERDQPFFILGKRFTDSNGAFRGAVFAHVDARIMQKVVANLSVAKEAGRAYILDQRGIVVAHPDISQVLLQKDFSSISIVSSFIKAKSDSFIQDVYQNELGEEVLGVAAPITFMRGAYEPGEPTKTAWFVVAEISAFTAFSGVREVTIFTFYILVALLVLAVFAALMFANRLSRPIEALHEVSRQFGKGNLTYQVPIHTRDEIEDLATSFYAMAADLRESLASVVRGREIIAAEKNQLQQVISGITDAVIVTDRARNIIIFNRAAEQLAGHVASAVLGKPINHAVRLWDGPQELDVTAFCPIRSDDFEGITFDKKGLRLGGHTESQIFVNVTAGHIREGTKVNVGCILAFEDVSREQYIEGTKREFVSVVAHQFRTPLSAMKWALGAFIGGDRGKVTKAQKGSLKEIYKANERLIRLVTDVLDVISVEEGRFGYHFRFCSLEDLATEAYEGLRILAKEQGIQFEFEKPADRLPSVWMDPERLYSVFQNILENAVQYTPRGGKVTLALEAKQSEIEVIVKDTGIGIPQDQFPRVFDKFFRAPNAVRKQTDGSGLGLYVSKNIVEKHQGKIWFESKEGQGTTFYFSVPIHTSKT